MRNRPARVPRARALFPVPPGRRAHRPSVDRRDHFRAAGVDLPFCDIAGRDPRHHRSDAERAASGAGTGRTRRTHRAAGNARPRGVCAQSREGPPAGDQGDRRLVAHLGEDSGRGTEYTKSLKSQVSSLRRIPPSPSSAVTAGSWRRAFARGPRLPCGPTPWLRACLWMATKRWRSVVHGPLSRALPI